MHGANMKIHFSVAYRGRQKKIFCRLVLVFKHNFCFHYQKLRKKLTYHFCQRAHRSSLCSPPQISTQHLVHLNPDTLMLSFILRVSQFGLGFPPLLYMFRRDCARLGSTQCLGRWQSYVIILVLADPQNYGTLYFGSFNPLLGYTEA